jgi:DNA-binding MarR family transcriptional regulator
MTQTLDEMERAGYVQRRPDPDDGRGRLVFLTPRGEAVQAIGAKAVSQVERRWAGLTGRDEIDALRGSLERVLDGLRQADEDRDR